ncbi:Crp/Fnr family transcriptional regulator [Aureimonas sp. AU12]|uniref:Crp/Fnr family transcriptional regulator n=1 Tax=Aureimonas sp. AU12 TaxID=1638161 RepID=UPI000784F29B|nr:Crp/Fnr family transcriptional regulator [Aureimonas sp. AU12]
MSISIHPSVSRLAAPVKGASDRSLRPVCFFDGVGDAILAEIGTRCRWAEVAEGEEIVTAGEFLDKVFFLRRGELRYLLYTRIGKIVALRGAQEGSFVGDTSLVGTTPVPYSVEAARTSLVASLPTRLFLECVDRDRDLARALVRHLVGREAQLADQIVELSTLNVQARIHNELIRLSRDGARPDGTAVIMPVPTHADLARRVCTQREAVSRELSHLQALGVVVRFEGGLLIPDVGRLKDLQIDLDL